ncbi:hypothetical protein [Streptomyces omiyaensis]|uniref:hypothetical protein n=1 Tax=Streptomyces omiyaensis TaxID=68247 RepID=UPI001E3FC91C|nr:hypothetical protein [Streptomyces omiyaensis]
MRPQTATDTSADTSARTSTDLSAVTSTDPSTDPSADTPTGPPIPPPSSGVQLVHDLLLHVPAFRGAYESHVFRQGGVLPHVFFWDVVQGTVRSFLAPEAEPDWRRTLDFLEERCGRGDTAVDEVIVTSFLGDLPSPHEPGHGIVRQLGPVMAAKFGRMRPQG